MSQITLTVPDMSCAHCEQTVRGALEGKPGVNTVQVDLPGKKVYLDYDESRLTVDTVRELLDEEGYPVESTSEGGSTDSGKRGFIPLTSK